MGVRSDDGFKVQIGASNPGDRYSTPTRLLSGHITADAALQTPFLRSTSRKPVSIPRAFSTIRAAAMRQRGMVHVPYDRFQLVPRHN